MCPRCSSSETSSRSRRTSTGYCTFACRACETVFNERTGTPFNDLQYPTDVVMLAVLWRLRYKLSFRDVAEMLLQRGFEVTHETVRVWEFRFAPLLASQLRAKRRGRAGVSWYLDETYLKVGGRWCYLYRAIDHRGELIDSMLSERRDKHAARRFLRRLVEISEGKPARITTDLHPAYRRAIRWIIGRKAWHRDDAVPEQLHRAEPSRREAALLPDARLRELRVSVAFLQRIRRAATVLSRSPPRRRPCLARRATTVVPGSLAFADRGGGCGVDRSLTRDLRRSRHRSSEI